MKIGSLFSGYGGLDLGVQAVLGGTVAWHVEFDPNPSRILAHHWPATPNYGDITATNFTTIEPVDVITGGFPCQDVSHAGRRAGLIRDGEGRTRSGLWGEMLRAIDTLRPGLVVAENVRGLLSAEADSDMEPCPWCVGGAPGGEPPLRALGAVLADLADIGYDAAWCGLRAADVGAPHGRFRIFILAWPRDTAPDTDHRAGDRQRPRPLPSGRSACDEGLTCSACGHLAERHHFYSRCDATPNQPESCRCLRTPTEIEAARKLLPSPRTSDTNGPGHHGDGGMDLRTAVTLLPTPAVNDMGAGKTVDAWDAWTERMKTAHGNGNGHGASLHVEALRMLPTPSVADVEGGRKTRSGARNDELLLNGIAHEQRFGDYAPAIARWENVLGRPAPAPTEPTGRDGAHRLSPRFVEWLMGLPKGHVTDVPDLTRNAQLKALGNGVVPQQAAAALTHLLTIRHRYALEPAA